MKSLEAAALRCSRVFILAALFLGGAWLGAVAQPVGDKQKQQAEAAYQKALAVLAKAPADGPANLTAGKYLCLVLGDWDRGLPYLMKSSDQRYKLLARADVRGPTHPEHRRELADDWWELAQAEAGDAKQRLQERAVYWYKKALPGLQGESAAAVKQRLAALTAKRDPMPPIRDVPEVFDTKQYLKLQFHEGDPMLKEPTMRFGLQLLPPQPDPMQPGQFKRLLADPLGRSCNTCLKVDGVELVLGVSGGRWEVQKLPLGRDRIGARSVWTTDDLPIRVTQTVELVRGEQTRKLDTCQVLYTIENTSKKRDYKVGLRFLLDTYIGTNDGAPFVVPGHTALCETLLDLKGEQIPPFLQALENPKRLQDPGTVASVKLKLGGTVEAPTRVTLGAWPSPMLGLKEAGGEKTQWNVPLVSMKALTPPDSAAVLYWDAKPLAPGAKREVGFSYGLGNYAGDKTGALGLVVGGQLYEGGQAEVVALVAAAKPGQKLTLAVPKGLVIEGDATRAVVMLPPDKDTVANPLTAVTWKVRAERKGVAQFKVKSSAGPSVVQDVRILEKPAAPKPVVDVVAILKKEQELLQGTWYVKTTSAAGKGAAYPVGLKVVVVGQTVTLHHGGDGGAETCFLKIDPLVEPKKFDVFPPKPGFQEPGIYRFQGQDLQLCLGARLKVAQNGMVVADAEKARPRTFVATAGTLLLLSRTPPKGK